MSDVIIKVDKIPKPFVFTPHAINQISDRTKIKDIAEHLYLRSQQYEVTTGLSSTGPLRATTYLRHTGSNVILVLEHNATSHVVVTGYTVGDCSTKLKNKKWQPFRSFEWEYA